MLGSCGNSLGNNGSEALHGRARSQAASRKAKKQEQQLNQQLSQLIEREWSELPYAMMRISAARRPWDGKHVYWRDRTVQLGDIDLNLVKVRAEEDGSGYAAAFSQEELRRDFTLHPSLEDQQLRWTAPGLFHAQFTTEQLAERLLSKLVTFYTVGLSSQTTAPSPASSQPSSS